MKTISTAFTILIIITGLSLKMMRLHRITQGEEPVSAFELGQEAAGASNNMVHSSEVQGNPFVK